MRFEPEITDDANAGLPLMIFLGSVKNKYPETSYADLFTLAGAVGAELTGCPAIHSTTVVPTILIMLIVPRMVVYGCGARSAAFVDVFTACLPIKKL
jgi:hypothetical protein